MASADLEQHSVFDRIVCVIDGSQASLEAAQQVGNVYSGLGSLDLVGFVDLGTVDSSIYGVDVVTEAERSLAARLAEAQTVCPGARSEVLHGSRIGRLLEVLQERNASLVAVGGSNRSRGVGIVRGSLTTSVLHRAPASVLVARPSPLPSVFPSSVVVGYDGSSGADAALAAGRYVAARFGARVRALVAGDVSAAELGGVSGLTVERDDRAPVEALLDASAQADLVIVGHRGLHGLRALESVSERVGHRAACSVLVVRDRAAG